MFWKVWRFGCVEAFGFNSGYLVYVEFVKLLYILRMVYVESLEFFANILFSLEEEGVDVWRVGICDRGILWGWFDDGVEGS